MLHFTVRELAFKSEDTSIFGQVEEQLKIEIKNVICDVLDVFVSYSKKQCLKQDCAEETRQRNKSNLFLNI